MKFLKLLIFLSVRFINRATTQRYRQDTKSNIFIINCTETHVSSLLHCTALSRESKDVTFFFDNQKKQCRLNCLFQYNMDAVIPGWQCYGLRIHIFITLLNWSQKDSWLAFCYEILSLRLIGMLFAFGNVTMFNRKRLC